MGLNWLITGGCGFIGVSLIDALKQDVETGAIVVFDDLSTGTREGLAAVTQFSEVETGVKSDQQVSLVVGSILDYPALEKATKGVDVIVHLAANTGVGPSVENPRLDMEKNVVGTFNCLEAARNNGVKRFVFASSGAPAGEVDPPIHEEMAPHPVSPYGSSKLAGEGYCSSYARTFGIDTVALRFGNVYGPRSGHKSSVVAKFIRQAMDGETLEVYGDGEQTRDFIYIADLVRAIKAAASIPAIGGEIFQIATNRETTVREMVGHLMQAFDSAGLDRPELIHGEQRLGDVRRNYSDTSKARDMLGWVPEETLSSGLQVTLDWFLQQRG